MQALESLEKATGKPLGQVPRASDTLVREAAQRSRIAGRDFARLSSRERLAPLGRLRSLLLESAPELAELLSRENGKPRHEALLHEVVSLIDAIDWLAKTVPGLAEDESLSPRWLKHRLHRVRLRPQGVTAILTPFNFPLLIAGFDALSALSMGSTVILKPSEHCPLVVQRFVELAHRAGYPEATLQVLHGGPAVGEQLLDSDLDAVRFTGSTENGRAIAVKAAARLWPCSLELGGNCPLLVLDDADLERTARGILYGALANSGQSCLAVGRVLVPRHLERELAERVASLVAGLRQGDPSGGPVELGALTTREQVARCQQHVLEAQASGARQLEPSRPREPDGHFFPPTLLTGCTPQQLVYRDESFGPIIAFVPYEDVSHVIEALNREPWGLAAYVFGRDTSATTSVAEQLDYGHVLVDQVLSSYVCPEVPLAPLRLSGLGCAHGESGLLSCVTPRVLGVPRLRLPTSLEFSLLDPAHAESVARAYLRSAPAVGTIARWLSG